MRANMAEAGEALLEDLEGLLREINEFCSAINNKEEEIPQSLERYLNYVAKSGNTVFPWQHVRPLFRNKILQSMGQFPGEVCPNNESFVLERFDLFRAAPFTIQRLTELITQPTRHYKKKEKFIRGLEKTVLVVSTVEPWSIDNDMRNGNDSASDGEMDQTYSESDDSSANRTFTMDQHDLLVTSGIHEAEHISLRNSSIDTRLQNVTTTMINITSNGNQSTTTIGSTSSSSSMGESMGSNEMRSSELGLSAVITSDCNADELIPQNSENLLPVNIGQVGEPVTTILGHGCKPNVGEIPDASFEPILGAAEHLENPNQQISSNLIVINIEPVESESSSSIIESGISEGVPSGSVSEVTDNTDMIEIDSAELPVSATIEVNENATTNTIEHEEQLSLAEPSTQEIADDGLKDAVILPVPSDESIALETVIPVANSSAVEKEKPAVAIPELEHDSESIEQVELRCEGSAEEVVGPALLSAASLDDSENRVSADEPIPPNPISADSDPNASS